MSEIGAAMQYRNLGQKEVGFRILNAGKWVDEIRYAKSPHAVIIVAEKATVDALLSINIDNRRVRSSHVEYFARESKEGRFALTSDGIGITSTGEMFNGQHRLLGLRQAGYPDVPILVIYGLEVSAKVATDRGVVRTYQDVFHYTFHRPEASSKMIAAARFYAVLTEGIHANHRVAVEAIEQTYMKLFPAFSLLIEIPNFEKIVTAPTLAAFAHRLTWAPDDLTTMALARKIASPEDHHKGTVALALREWILSGSTATNRRGGSAEQLDRFHKTCNAILRNLSGQPVIKLYANEDAWDELECFPICKI